MNGLRYVLLTFSYTWSIWFLKYFNIPASKRTLVLNGVRVRVKGLPENQLSTIYIDNELFGIGEVLDNQLVIHTRLYEGVTK